MQRHEAPSKELYARTELLHKELDEVTSVLQKVITELLLDRETTLKELQVNLTVHFVLRLWVRLVG